MKGSSGQASRRFHQRLNIGRGALLTLESTGHIGRESTVPWEPRALGSNFSLPLASCVASPLWALVSLHLRAGSGLDHPPVPLALIACLLDSKDPGKSRQARAVAQGGFP